MRGFKRYKYSIFLLMLTIAGINQYCSQSKAAPKVTISAKDQPLEQVMHEIGKQTKYDYVTTQDVLDKAEPVNIDVTRTNINTTLDLLFKDGPLTYEIVNNTILIKQKDE